MDSAVLISSVVLPRLQLQFTKIQKNCMQKKAKQPSRKNKASTILFRAALLTLLMMTAESMLSKRPVLRVTAALFVLLKLFSSHVYN